MKKRDEPKFLTWLWENRYSRAKFAKMSKVCHVSVQKAARGEPLRLDTIKRIIRFTDNALKVEDFNVWEPLH